MQIRNSLATIAIAATTSLVVGGGGLAFASSTGLIHTRDIANGAVTLAKLAPHARKELSSIQGKTGATGAQGAKGDTGATGATGPQGPQGDPGQNGTNGTDGTNGKDGANGKDVDPTTVTNLQNEITALQDQINGQWNSDAGVLANDADHLSLTEAQGSTTGAGASKNLVLEYHAGEQITVSGTLSDGAQAGQGAPRAFIIIDGVVYTSVDNVNPNYGTSADGSTFTQTLVPVSYSGKNAPSGLITQVGLAYDNTSAPGTATFTTFKIGNTVIPFA